MAKRKRKSAGTVEETQGLLDGQWQIGQWHGIDTLRCIHCKWDTMDGIEAAHEHQAHCARCGPQAAPARVVLVADKWGSESQRSEQDE